MRKALSVRQVINKKRGFTLVEMLVVVGIIGLLLALGTTGINRIDKGQSLDVSKALIATMLEEVRLRSSVSSERVGLVIHNDVAATGRYEERPMRYVAIATFKEEPGASAWELDARGEILSKRIYMDLTGKTVENINLPGEGSVQCAVIEFKNGRFAGTPQDSVIVLADTRRLPGQAPVFGEGTRRIETSSGIKIWGNGSQSEFRNVKQMTDHEKTL